MQKKRKIKRKAGSCPFASRAAAIALTAPSSAPAPSSCKFHRRPVFYGNAGGNGYYRARYTSDDYQQLLRQVETSRTPPERITFLGSEWAQARAGIAPVGDFLNLAAAVRDDSNSFVMTTVSTALRGIDQQVASTPEEHAEIAVWVRKNFAPALSRLGLPAAGEAPDKSLLRAALYGLLGNTGADPQIIADARQVAQRYLATPPPSIDVGRYRT